MGNPKRDLYPFQKQGVEFLLQRKGGFLWDDPGLGKTTQAIVAAKEFCPSGPILIVCPNTLKRHWRREVSIIYPDDSQSIAIAGEGGRFTVWSSSRTGHVAKHEVHADLIHPTPIWTIVHYTGVRLARVHFKFTQWRVVIADECHYIKNRQALRTAALMDITPKNALRIGLTATPYSKSPADIWSQLHWRAPNNPTMSSYWRFFYLFVEYTEERGNHGRKYKRIRGGKNLDVLGQVMTTYGVCRAKAVVAPQLPPLTDTDMPLAMTRRQVVVDRELRKKVNVELVIQSGSGKDVEYTGLLIKNTLVRMLRMEQWLSHPWTFDKDTKGSKWEWLEEWTKENTKAAVIVTRFKASAHGIAKLLGVKALTGDMPQKLRGIEVSNWSGGQGTYLVGTIHTLGTGLNLQRAHTLICYDQVYSPALMEQVRHRIHRVTSDHPVEVVYLYNEGTSNQIVLKAYRNKWNDLQVVKAFLALVAQEGGDNNGSIYRLQPSGAGPV